MNLKKEYLLLHPPVLVDDEFSFSFSADEINIINSSEGTVQSNESKRMKLLLSEREKGSSGTPDYSWIIDMIWNECYFYAKEHIIPYRNNTNIRDLIGELAMLVFSLIDYYSPDNITLSDFLEPYFVKVITRFAATHDKE